LIFRYQRFASQSRRGLRWAAAIPAVRYGAIAVRPLMVTRTTTCSQVEAVFRREWGRVVAVVTRLTGDLGVAEDAV